MARNVRIYILVCEGVVLDSNEINLQPLSFCYLCKFLLLIAKT